MGGEGGEIQYLLVYLSLYMNELGSSAENLLTSSKVIYSGLFNF